MKISENLNFIKLLKFFFYFHDFLSKSENVDFAFNKKWHIINLKFCLGF